MSINWGAAQGNGFNNALAMGMQFGSRIRQRNEEKEYRNALAQYDPNNPDTIKPIMEVDPRTGFALQQQAHRAQAQQQEQRQADMGTFRKLLRKAAESPEGWAQALGAARSMGLDLSNIPQQYDPQWAQEQLFIADALESERENLPGIAREVMFGLGIDDPSDPRVQQGVLNVIKGKYAYEYTDEMGNRRRGSTVDFAQQGAQPQVAEGATATNPQTGEKIIFRNGAWEPMGGTAGNGGGGFPAN